MFNFALLIASLCQGLVWVGSPLRASEVYDAYVKLPLKGKDDPCAIEVVPDHRFKYPAALGYYNIGADQMWIRASQDSVMFKETVAHEYGHHIYFLCLTDQEYAEWNTFWKANVLAMPGGYAKTSASEGWAECYAVRFVGAESSYYEPGTKLPPEIGAKVDALLQRANKAEQHSPRGTGDHVCRVRSMSRKYRSLPELVAA